MEPRWNEKAGKWIASTGSGSNRIWFKSKTPGEAGRRKVLQRMGLLAPEEEKPLRPGSLAEFIEKVWKPTVKASTDEDTWRGYASIIRNHFRPLFGKRVEDLTLEVLQPWISGCTKKVKAGTGYRDTGELVGDKTRENIWGVMTSILHYAEGTGRQVTKGWTLVHVDSAVREASEALVPDEIDVLLAACVGKFAFMEGPVWAAGWVGLRRAECTGLKVTDIALKGEAAVLTLSRQRKRKDKESPRLKNKAKGDRRIITMPRWMGEKLLSYAPPGAIYVFHKDGKPINVDRITETMPLLCEAAGLPRTEFRELRTSLATNLRDDGTLESVISDVLGHKDVKVTNEHYLRTRGAAISTALGGLQSTRGNTQKG